MKTLKLLPKNEDSLFLRQSVIDDLFPALLSADFYCTTTTGDFSLLDYYIDRFKWPKYLSAAEGDQFPRIYSFIKGHKPELAEKFEFYEA